MLDHRAADSAGEAGREGGAPLAEAAAPSATEPRQREGQQPQGSQRARSRAAAFDPLALGFDLNDLEPRRSARQRKQVERFEEVQAREAAPKRRAGSRARSEGGSEADSGADDGDALRGGDARNESDSSDDEWGARSRRGARRRRRSDGEDLSAWVEKRTSSRIRDKQVSYAEQSSSDGEDAEEEEEEDDNGAEQVGEGEGVQGGDDASVAFDEMASGTDEPERAIDCIVDSRKALGGGEMEFLVKWQQRSYMHCTWETRESLAEAKGARKLDNYIRKQQELESIRRCGSVDEVEKLNVDAEVERQAIAEHYFVERVIAEREVEALEREPPAPLASASEGASAPLQEEQGEQAEGSAEQAWRTVQRTEYLCKWRGLPYSDCTWESEADILPRFQQLVRDFHERERQLWENPPSTGSGALTVAKARAAHLFSRLTAQPAWLTGGTLRDYQLEGLNWLIYSWHKETNCILADEMGLGKTIQCISTLGYLFVERGLRGPFLVVVPLSTINSWKREFVQWAPWMNVVVYVGDQESRQLIRDVEFWREPGEALRRGRGPRAARFAVHVCLTTYEYVLKDQAHLRRIAWRYLMVDEAHRLKDSQSQLYRTLFDFHASSRLLITGTPLQNSLRELWCLLHFLDPQKFNDADDFETRYQNINSMERIAALHDILRPHLLRRVKKQVEKSLPAKSERILSVELAPMQRRYLQMVVARNFRELNKGVKGKKSSLQNVVMEMKKCCNHPFLFESAEAEERRRYEERRAAWLQRKRANPRLEEPEPAFDHLQALLRHSGKMQLLDKLLVRLRDTGHRVLIFSQMVRMLDILSTYLRLRGFPFQRLDGSMAADSRTAAMDHFNAPGSSDFAFLLSTRAGGLGINLATADTVIIFDSDWNPQNDLQAESRAHRIGQKKAVNIYRLICKGSVEENILERAKRKMVLDHLVIQRLDTQGRGENASGGAGIFDKKELNRIIQFGASDLFKSAESGGGEDGESKAAEEVDLDAILARAESGVAGTESEADSFLAAFNVASFTTLSRDESDGADSRKSSSQAVETKAHLQEDEADDADFWRRTVPSHMIPADQLREEGEAELIFEPRKRTAVTTYNENALAQQAEDDGDDEEEQDEAEENVESDENLGPLDREARKLHLNTKVSCARARAHPPHTRTHMHTHTHAHARACV